MYTFKKNNIPFSNNLKQFIKIINTSKAFNLNNNQVIKNTFISNKYNYKKKLKFNKINTNIYYYIKNTTKNSVALSF